MKKILFSAYSLGLGGIETALVTLLKELSKKYEITLVLEKKEGIFFNEVPSSVEIIEFTPNDNKNIIIRKCTNLLKQIQFYIKYHNKFAFACSFATYSRAGSYCARVSSKKRALWVHNDYTTTYKDSINDFYTFFNSVKYDKFKTIVFVSNEARINYNKMYPNSRQELITCNNLINYESILEKADEYIEEKKDDITTFLNVGRHDEHQKRLTRLIEASKILKDQDYKFKIIMLGTGRDTEYYKQLVTQYKLEDYIIFLGTKKNPYPYYKISDAVILTSDYEGYPVVFVESYVLERPILTTDVSDAKDDIEGKYGIIMDKDSSNIAESMKNYIENGYKIKEKFNPKEFNGKIINKIIDIIEGKKLKEHDENETSKIINSSTNI